MAQQKNRRLTDNQRKVVEEIYREFYEYVLGKVRQQWSNAPVEVDELAQRVFEAVANKVCEGCFPETEGQRRSWLKRAVKLQGLQYQRGRNKQGATGLSKDEGVFLVEQETYESVADEKWPTPENFCLMKETTQEQRLLIKQLLAEIRKLPERQRVLLEAEIRSKNRQEVAAKAGIPFNQAAMYVKRARAKLLAGIQEESRLLLRAA